jgi:hypothetical protein
MPASGYRIGWKLDASAERIGAWGGKGVPATPLPSPLDADPVAAVEGVGLGANGIIPPRAIHRKTLHLVSQGAFLHR